MGQVMIVFFKRRLLTVAFLGTALIDAHATVETVDSTTCRELCHYRDVELYQQFEAAFNSYEVSAEERATLLQMRTDLLSKPEWSTSDTRLASAALFTAVKMTCDLTLNLLKLNPAATLSTRAVSATRITVANIAKAAVGGAGVVRSTVENGIEATAYKEVVAELNPLLTAIKAVDDFKGDLDKMMSLGKDRDELRAEVTRVIDLVSANIDKHNRSMQNSVHRLEDIERTKQGIDSYLTSHHCERYCVGASQPAVVSKKQGPTAGTASPDLEKALGPGQVYVFFALKLGSVTVFSRPVRANGFEDPLREAKVAFVESAQEQFPQLSKDLKRDMSSDQYQRVQPKYAAPWSRERLLTPAAADAAMQAYEQDIRSSLQGLSGAESISFLYLK